MAHLHTFLEPDALWEKGVGCCGGRNSILSTRCWQLCGINMNPWSSTNPRVRRYALYSFVMFWINNGIVLQHSAVPQLQSPVIVKSFLLYILINIVEFAILRYGIFVHESQNQETQN
jgi:hypothetical protein